MNTPEVKQAALVYLELSAAMDNIYDPATNDAIAIAEAEAALESRLLQAGLMNPNDAITEIEVMAWPVIQLHFEQRDKLLIVCDQD